MREKVAEVDWTVTASKEKPEGGNGQVCILTCIYSNEKAVGKLTISSFVRKSRGMKNLWWGLRKH